MAGDLGADQVGPDQASAPSDSPDASRLCRTEPGPLPPLSLCETLTIYNSHL